MMFFPMPDPLATTTALENYLFDRYIHTLLRIFVLLSLILVPILLPLNVIGGKGEAGGVQGLDKLSFANVGVSHCDRYWAHLVLAIFVVVAIGKTVQFELSEYRRLQEDFESDASWQAHTIMITSASRIDADQVRRCFEPADGGICVIEMKRDFGSLHAPVRMRNRLSLRLEDAETELIKKANSAVSRPNRSERWRSILFPRGRPHMRIPIVVRGRLVSIPLAGPKVDTINYCRSEIVRLNHVINLQCRMLRPNGPAFVTFNHETCRHIGNGIPKAWVVSPAPTPEDIVWENLHFSPRELLARHVMVHALTVALVIGISLPVSASQILYLANAISSLAHVEFLPRAIFALVQGVLFPSLVVFLLSNILPPSLRLIVQLRGSCSRRTIKSFIQRAYFVFLFIQIFIISSTSISFAAAVTELREGNTSAVAVLARVLPSASNYFFSHVIISTASMIYVMVIRVNFVGSFFTASTPRQKWEQEESVFLKEWDCFLPIFANLACIGMIDRH